MIGELWRSVLARWVGSFLAVILILGCSGTRDTHRLNQSDPVSYTPMRPERWTLPNGLTVLLIQDHELPIVRGTLYLKGGSLWEKPDEFGVTSAMGALMRLGGAGARSADGLDLELEKLSAKVGSSFGGESGNVGFSSLATDFDRVFSIFSDVVLRPRFEESRLALWKGQTLEGIRRRADDPETVAGTAFAQLLYGDSVYGRVLLSSDVKKISRGAIVEAHRRFVRPDGAILAIAGDVDSAKLKEAIGRTFSAWRSQGMDFVAPPSVSREPTPGIYFIKKPFEQATVLAGQLGVRRLDPDYPAIDVFNQLFGGGGFGSELVKRVREDRGLAYVVYGGMAAGLVRGKHFIGLQTKSQSVGDALEESLGVLSKLQSGDVERVNIEESKRGITNAFVFKLDSTDDLVQRRAILELLKFPESYDDTYVGKIQSVSYEDIVGVARKHWDPSKFVTVVVGGEDAERSLKESLQRNPGALKGVQFHEARFDEQLIK